MALTFSYKRMDQATTDETIPNREDFENIASCLKFFAKNIGSRRAVVFASPDRVYPREEVTFLQLYQRSTIVAKALINLGIRPGEIVAVNIRPCPEWLYMTFGAILAGAVMVGVSFTYSDGSDLVALMDRLKTCSLLALDTGTDGSNWEIVERLLDDYNDEGKVRSKKLPYLRHIISHAFPDDGTCPQIRSVAQMMQDKVRDLELPLYQNDDPVVIFQTSGSTGIPKFVVHTHKSLINCLSRTDLFGNTTFNDRPFQWSGGFPHQVLLGETRVTVSNYGQHAAYDLHRMIDIIREEDCKIMLVLPPRLSELIENQDQLPEDWPMEVVVTGGQPIKHNLIKALGKVCRELTNAYGATEFTVVTTKKISDGTQFQDYNTGHLLNIPGSEIKIVDSKGNIVPSNTKGEILIKSSAMFKEYHNDPEKTAKVFDDDGWFKTDDIGLMAENGELFVYGRKSNMILSGGMNVSPEILEDVLRKCPGVENAVIVPVSDQVFYQVVCACVIVSKSHVVTETDLKTFCENVHNDKPGMFTVLPKFYLFFENFPETYTGKTGRKIMQHMAEEKFRSS